MQVFILNGFPRSEKNTLVDFVTEQLESESSPYIVHYISTVQKAKNALKILGWDGKEKTPSIRNTLNVLKTFSSEMFDQPFKDVKEQVSEENLWQWGHDRGILFIDSREPDEIERFKKEFGAKTILVTRTDSNTSGSENSADNNVLKFKYDYIIENKGTLPEFKQQILKFIRQKIRRETDMDICFITPTPLLQKFAAQSRSHLVLAHVYKEDEAYREFYKDRVRNGEFVMLDNSAYELGTGIDAEALKEIALDLKPSAIFLPDVRFDSVKTLAVVEKAIPVLKDLKDIYNNPVKLIGVPQGNSLKEVDDCYDELVKLGIKNYGIYEEIGVVTKLGRRWDYLKHLEGRSLFTPEGYYHMLGMEEDVQNISKLAAFDWVDSIDSVKPIAYGLKGITFAKDGPKMPYPHRPADYFNISDLSFERTIHINCLRAKEWIKRDFQ